VYGSIRNDQRLVLEKWVRIAWKGKNLKISCEKVRPVGRRKEISIRAVARVVFEIIDEVRLVIVAAGDSHVGPIVMGSGFDELINLFETGVAAQLFGGYTDALFEFARQMTTAQAEVAGQLLNGDVAFALFYDPDGFLGDRVMAKIGCKALDQIPIDGFDAGSDASAVIANMFDKFAPPGPPEVIHIGVLVDQLMSRILEKRVAAAGQKTDPEEMDGTGRPHPHGAAHRSGNPGAGDLLYLVVAIYDFDGRRQIEYEFKAFGQQPLPGGRNRKGVQLQGPIVSHIRPQAWRRLVFLKKHAALSVGMVIGAMGESAQKALFSRHTASKIGSSSHWPCDNFHPSRLEA
jgi:hypothetical protein